MFVFPRGSRKIAEVFAAGPCCGASGVQARHSCAVNTCQRSSENKNNERERHGHRKACHRQSHAAADTVPDPVLLRGLSRSGQCQLCQAAYEPGARVSARPPSASGPDFSSSLIFCSKCPPTLSGAGWRAALDRAHHDLVGDCLSGIRLYSVDRRRDRRFERGRILHPSLIARRMRGWLLSRHHLLSDLVVSGPVSRAGRQLLHVGDPDFIDHWIADIRNVAEPDRLGIGRLAMAVHSRSVAIAPCGHSACCFT